VLIYIGGIEMVQHMICQYVLVAVKWYFTCCVNIYWCNSTAQVVVIFIVGSEILQHILK